MTRPTTRNYFVKQTKKGMLASFVATRKPTPLTRRGYLKFVTIKGVTSKFNSVIEQNLATEEKIVAAKISDILRTNNKTSYNELYSRVSSLFAKQGIRLGKQPINNNSVATLYKKLIKMGAIEEQKQTPKKPTN